MQRKISARLVANIRRNFKQFLSMKRENKRALVQEAFDNQNTISKVAVYKPTYTLEFDRCGELLLYSCDTLRHKTIYFKYPYVLYEAMVPFFLWMFIVNPFAIYWSFNYVNLLLANFLCFPRAWYLRSMQYRIRRMYLLRGGRYVKFERNSIAGDQFTNWGEVREFQPLTQDFRDFADPQTTEFLNKEGQLNYELGVECENFRQYSITEQDVAIFFMKEGIVHHPEVFDAVVRGLHIDTSDFVINTANEERSREPSYAV